LDDHGKIPTQRGLSQIIVIVPKRSNRDEA
jgi:hypothetical protein